MILLNSLMLRKDYLIFGIVNFSEKLTTNYKLIFRKTLKFDSNIAYEIIPHSGILTYDDLEKYINTNNDKILITVMKTYKSTNRNRSKSILDNYLIFKKNLTPDRKSYDYLLTEVVKDKYTEFSTYLKDISNKMNMFSDESVKFNLSCCINNENSLFLVFYEELDKDEEEALENNEN